MKKCILYKNLENNQVQCLACAHYCNVALGKTGICGVRKNEQGKLYLLVYGKAAVSHVDPIEKKPLYHFMPGTKTFSIGTIGCNFHCGFCQNWDISQVKSLKLKVKSSQYGMGLSPEEAVDYCLKNKIPSIAYTYNEPTVWVEYAYEIMKLAKKNGLKNIFVSDGYQSKECLELISDHLDAINIDLKAFTNDFYSKICGAKLKPVLETIRRVKQKNIHLEITTLIVPDQNDSPDEITLIAKFIAKTDKSIPWHISRFFPQYQMNHLSPTELDKLTAAYKIGKRADLKYVYLGNVSDWKHESTYCSKCGQIAIKRFGYSIKKLDNKGLCSKCGESLDIG